MPRKRDGKKYSLDLPIGATCLQCKSFGVCSIKKWANEADEQCSLVPSNFALIGEESTAERLNREAAERYLSGSLLSQ